MPDEVIPDDERTEPTGLEQRLRKMVQDAIPDGLLDRCLATVPRTVGPRDGRGRRLWVTRAVGAGRRRAGVRRHPLCGPPWEAAAGHFLQAVQTTWTEVPACHRVTVMSGPLFSRTEEGWFVRGKGALRSPFGRHAQGRDRE